MRTASVAINVMTPDADDLSSTFIPGTTRAGVYFPRLSGPRESSKEPVSDSIYASGTSASEGTGRSDVLDILSSPDGGMQKSLQINMKGLVGDAVGNVSSYSPRLAR